MVITEIISQMRTEVDKDKITYPKTQSPVLTLTPQWLTTLYLTHYFLYNTRVIKNSTIYMFTLFSV